MCVLSTFISCILIGSSVNIEFGVSWLVSDDDGDDDGIVCRAKSSGVECVCACTMSCINLRTRIYIVCVCASILSK